ANKPNEVLKEWRMAELQRAGSRPLQCPYCLAVFPEDATRCPACKKKHGGAVGPSVFCVAHWCHSIDRSRTSLVGHSFSPLRGQARGHSSFYCVLRCDAAHHGCAIHRPLLRRERIL